VAPDRLDAALARSAARKATLLMEAARRIFVKDGERCWFVTLTDVVLLESEGNYPRLNFGSNWPLLLARPIIWRSGSIRRSFPAPAGSIF
jgi:hypothetical protein